MDGFEIAPPVVQVAIDVLNQDDALRVAKLLRAAGVDVNPETQGPLYDPQTFETNVPGLYVAGAVVAGTRSGTVFIENGRLHGQQVIDAIVERQRAERERQSV